MYSFNENASQTLKKVATHFGAPVECYNPIRCDYSIGIEIEVKFKHYYPELFEKYFKNNSWNSYSQSEKDIINQEISEKEEETQIKNKLEKVLELGVEKGEDCYWEFALDPVTDLSLIVSQINLLKYIGLLPEGIHSVHLTIGNAKKDEDIHWVLFLVEMILSSKERLITGANKQKRSTYFRKGESGLLEKRWRLKECKSAIEFRTLELVIDEDMDSSFTIEKMNRLNNLLNDQEYLDIEIIKCKDVLRRLNIPVSNWKNYKDNPEIWDMYYENYDKIKYELS